MNDEEVLDWSKKIESANDVAGRIAVLKELESALMAGDFYTAHGVMDVVASCLDQQIGVIEIWNWLRYLMRMEDPDLRSIIGCRLLVWIPDPPVDSSALEQLLCCLDDRRLWWAVKFAYEHCPERLYDHFSKFVGD